MTALIQKPRFKQAGAGAVTRLALDKMQERATVADYGGADALEKAGAAHKVVWLEPGEHQAPLSFANPTGAAFVQLPWANLQAGVNLMAPSYYPDQGPAGIQKYWTRVFVGPASKGNGHYLGNVSSGSGPGWIERDAQMMVASQAGLTALAGSSKSSDVPAFHGAPATIGVSGAVINDRANAQAWAIYGDVAREAGAGATFGLELAVKNKGDDVTRRAYSKSWGALGIWLAAGGDASYGGAPAAPSNAAIIIGKNASTWNRGIVFDNDGITGTDGVTGYGVAIEFACRHVLQWSTAQNQPGMTVVSETTDALKRVTIKGRNNTFELLNAQGKPFGRMSNADNAVNFVETLSAVAGEAARVTAQGDDANVDLWLTGKGGGNVRFGFWLADIDRQINGYVLIKDNAGNVRKLATIA